MLSRFEENERLRLTILDILVDLRCVVGRISFLDYLHNLRYSNPQIQRPHRCACLGQAYRSSSRGGIFVMVHFLHQPFLRGLQWPKTRPLHRVVVTGLTKRGGVHGFFERRLRVTASDHCKPTRLVAIVQQRSWETGEVQRVSRLPRGRISVNKPKERYSKAIRIYLSFIELHYGTKRADRRFASADAVTTLNPVPERRGTIINLGLPLRPIRVIDTDPLIHRGRYGLFPRVGQDRLEL